MAPQGLLHNCLERHRIPSSSQRQPNRPQEEWSSPLILNWWWEIGAILVSLIAMLLIFVILFMMNGKSLASWQLPIQINSLIAVFSTISKSALLLALAEGLSQLKWNAFEKQGGATLDQLQIMDDASRGPWGSLMMPFKTSRANYNVLAWIGAGLTVLAIAFEPFAQQIIQFPSRVVESKNETATLRMASGFDMPPDPMTHLKEEPMLSLLREIVPRLPDPTIPVNLYLNCPTSDCKFEEHWSLAACTRCEDKILDNDTTVITYSWNSDKESGTLDDFKAAMQGATSELYVNSRADIRHILFIAPADTPISFSYHHTLIDVTEPFAESLSDYTTETYGYAAENPTTSAQIVVNYQLSLMSQFPLLSDLATWEGVKLLSQKCGIEFCAKLTKSLNVANGMILQESEEFRDLDIQVSCNLTHCDHSAITEAHFVEGHGPNFRFHTGTRKRFGGVVQELLNDFLNVRFVPTYFRNMTLENFSKTMSNVISSFLRSEQNSNSTNLRGKALRPETYVLVRWQWVVFPSFIVVSSVLFLALTIWDSSRKEQLYKSSILAGYFHQFVLTNDKLTADPEDSDLDLPKSLRRDTDRDLEKVARGVKLRLQRTKDGRLELIHAP